jgi:acyl-CoA synthetase (NDP forming)
VTAFSTETRALLAPHLPFAASTTNPVDMVASAGPDEYREAIQVALADRDTDALLVIYAPVDVKQAEATLGCGRC